MDCPRCRTPLCAAREQTSRGRLEIDHCTSCGGVWFDAKELAFLLNLDNHDAFSLESPLLTGSEKTDTLCPRDHHAPMAERQLVSSHAKENPCTLRLDQCLSCEGIWLDGQELSLVSYELSHARLSSFLSEPARPTSRALWLFMFVSGLPVEEWNPRLHQPMVVIGLVTLCAAIFFCQNLLGLEHSIHLAGMVPAKFLPLIGSPLGDKITLLSHMFLHGSIPHLLGNLYFLWVFGDNVEDRLGSLRLALIYLGSGLVAGLLHVLLTTQPAIPVVGASGAISGIMAAYALLFPQARLISLILFWQVRWRSSTYLAMWLILQVVGALLLRSGIAWWAHIGGFLTGALIAWFSGRRPR